VLTLVLIVEWEGFDALEPIEVVTTGEPSQVDETQTKGAESLTKAEELEETESWKQRQQRRSPAELSESSDDESGDEYVDEGNRREDVAGRHQRKVRHRTHLRAEALRAHGSLSRQRTNNRRIAAVSSSDSEDNEEKAATTSAHARRANVTSTKTKMVSTSPQPGMLKRKQSISATGVATASTATKRKRAESNASAAEDATRKYCLGKFAEMFMGIFMQYPYVQENNTEEDGAERKKVMVERKPEELTEDDKTQLREGASAFATEVEQAVFDTYAEPDKSGKPGAGVKYKYVSWPLTYTVVLMRTSNSFLTGSAFAHLPLTCSNPTVLHYTSEYPPGKLHPRRSLLCLRQNSRRRNNKSPSNKPNRRPLSIPS
jgi:hypothetical protein